MRLRYAYVPVLLLVSFSAMTNVWASSFLSHNERDFRFAVSSDTVRGSRISKQDSIFKTLNLDEVVVTAAIKEVEMKGDTTVINANAFKTAEGAYLEELLKRVPGLEYEKQNKTMTYNGLPIHEINVNGESFFGGNSTLALENLPAKLVSKIKVYDKRSELEKITKVRKGGENYVLDLQTKREFNGTLITSAGIGRGNNDKKEAELISNLFRQTGDNISVIARSGNRYMTSRYPDNRQDNVAMNFAKKFSKRFTLYGNMMYNHYASGNESTLYSEQYLTTGNRYQNSASTSTNRNTMGNGTLGMRWSLDDKTYINVGGNFSKSKGDNTSDSQQSTTSAVPTATSATSSNTSEGDERINSINRKSDSKSDSHSFSLNADVTRVLNDKGTSISLTGSYSDSKSTNESHSLSETTYYQLESSLGGDSVLYRNQYQHSPSTNRAYSVGINLTQPLAENLHLQLGYRYAATRQMSDRSTYESEVYMDSLSNHTLSKTITHDLSLYLNYDGKRWEANAGVLMQPERRSLDQKTGLLHADTVRTSVNWNPQLNVSWHRGKTRFELNYDGSSRQPDLGSLMSLTDNSDPLHITHGNPSLKASYNQNFRLTGRNTRLGLSGDVNFSNTYNSQTQAVFYNLATGGTETYPVNVNGNWNMRASLRYQKRWKKRFNLSARTGASFAQSVALVNEGKSEEPDRSVTHNTSYNANLRLGYQPKWGGFDLQGDWRYRHATNQLRGTSNYTRSYNFSLNTYAELPLGFLVKSDVAYSFRNGTNIKKGEDDQVVWNLGASWRFLKKKQAELSLYWSDILSDKKNYYRNVTATGLTESRTSQIGSYFIISFKYRLNKQL
ncbi:outer membrane beta-barrel protein [Segatella copri]|uniref:Outer membrane beta-barrel protein n=1 Tax=Segatella copri TaxID=165179 RepID=A0AA90ZR25_9BACT|nr:outer membrane beta-barrel protein [Segatella copri]MQN82455.1 outer membrane beta-barrel protein [Segatella copri]